MRLFAVILAAVAALAATAQAYLSWSYLDKQEDRRLNSFLEGRKILTCSRLVSATAEYQRKSENLDAYYSAALDYELERLGRYEEDEDPEVLAERAAKAAREAVLERFRNGARDIFEFIDEGPIYFSEEELPALGYETYMELPADLGELPVRYETAALVKDEEAYNQALDVIRRIGALKPDVIETCKPIMRRS